MPTNSRSSQVRLPAASIAVGAIVFAVLATLNAGGYRYGAADQAFYIPAIRHQLDPSLFPRDWAMLGAQGKFFFVDEIAAGLVAVTGLSLETWFALAQIATLAVFFTGAWLLGTSVLTSPWALAAWIAALTLRHRVTKTGVNTLEGYFHPRVLVFGLGLTSLALFLRGRPWWALLLAIASGGLHPTTGALFAGLLVVATVVGEPAARVPAAAAIGLGLVGIGTAIAVGAFDVQAMDEPWLALLATKDYVFPTQWSLETWLVNLLGPVLLVTIAGLRLRRGLALPRERGLMVGALALVTGFLLSLPVIAHGVALAIQLQTSRVFWPVEVLATLYLVWWLAEAGTGPDGGRARARLLAAGLVTLSLGRGVYVAVVERPDRPAFALTLPDDDWTRALAWVRQQTPAATLVVADPGHAWKPGMGTAVRIGAERDVYLEEVKDVAMAMYARDTAQRVAARIEATQSFDERSASALQALVTEGPAVLVTDRQLDLPLRFSSGAMRVYQLDPP